MKINHLENNGNVGTSRKLKNRSDETAIEAIEKMKVNTKA